ncbi:hypothetical protein M758_4G120100 [Ceratodon purpureus]|nr:hypothetical protein M758_4G120100 [Ceratodon purpureus]
MVVCARHGQDSCKYPYNHNPEDDRVQLETVMITQVIVSQVLREQRMKRRAGIPISTHFATPGNPSSKSPSPTNIVIGAITMGLMYLKDTNQDS